MAIVNINRGYFLRALFLFGSDNEMFTGAYLIILVYIRLLTITLTWQSSCVIVNYNQKTSEIYSICSSVLSCYLEDGDVKKYTWETLCLLQIGASFIIMFMCEATCFVCDIIK